MARVSEGWCPDGDFLAIFQSRISSEPRAAHSKFTLRSPMCGSMVDIQSPTAEIRRGNKKKKKKETTAKNITACPIP